MQIIQSNSLHYFRGVTSTPVFSLAYHSSCSEPGISDVHTALSDELFFHNTNFKISGKNCLLWVNKVKYVSRFSFWISASIFLSCCIVYTILNFNVLVCFHDSVFTALTCENLPVCWKCLVKCVVNSTTHNQHNFIIIKIITHNISLQHISSIVSDLQTRPTYVNNENILQIYKIIKVNMSIWNKIPSLQK